MTEKKNSWFTFNVKFIFGTIQSCFVAFCFDIFFLAVKRHFQDRGKDVVSTDAGKDTESNTKPDTAAFAMETLSLGSTNTEQKKTKKKRKKTKKPK